MKAYCKKSIMMLDFFVTRTDFHQEVDSRTQGKGLRFCEGEKKNLNLYTSALNFHRTPTVISSDLERIVIPSTLFLNTA